MEFNMQEMQCPSLPKLKNRFKKIHLLFLVLIGCNTFPLDVYYAIPEGVDLSVYKTFAIEPILDNDNFYDTGFIKLLNTAIVDTLNKKGCSLADSPELIVKYSLEIDEDKSLKLEHVPFEGLIQTKAMIEAVFEAKMLVNAVDIKTGQIIWKAATTKDLRSVSTKKINQARVNKRMGELFQSFRCR
jgi:Domain of unknown function (DUF4136)